MSVIQEKKLAYIKSVSGMNNHFYGRVHTQSTKDAISKANSGKKRTQTQKDNMSKILTGKKRTPVQKDNISRAVKKAMCRPEVRKKLLAAINRPDVKLKQKKGMCSIVAKQKIKEATRIRRATGFVSSYFKFITINELSTNLKNIFQYEGKMMKTEFSENTSLQKICGDTKMCEVLQKYNMTLDDLAILAGIQFRTTKVGIGTNETQILNTIEKTKNVLLSRQYQVGLYRIDGYDVKNNIAYEVDELHHFNKMERLKDSIREEKIKSVLGCTFVRIPDIKDIHIPTMTLEKFVGENMQNTEGEKSE